MNKLCRLIAPLVLTALSAALILPNTMFAAGEWRFDHPPQLILTETTPIYDNNSNKKIAELSPQTVTVTGAYLPRGYEIDTWLGKKWILITDVTKAIPHDPNFVTKKLQLNQTLYLYNYPVQYSQTATALSPQTVEAVDYWDGFYKIKTWLGDKWIAIPDAYIQKITLTDNTNLYENASENSRILGALAPQTVEAYERNGNLFHIHTTWVGDAWIKDGLL